MRQLILASILLYAAALPAQEAYTWGDGCIKNWKTRDFEDCITSPPIPVDTLAPTHEATKAQSAKVQAAIKEQLKDPDSAKFGAKILIRATIANPKEYRACGTFNSKNAMGGYVGNHAFYVVIRPDSQDSVDLDDDEHAYGRMACEAIGLIPRHSQ